MKNSSIKAQSIMIGIDGTELSGADRHRLAHPAVGAVCLFTRNFIDNQALNKLVNDIRKSIDKKLLIATDHEGGRVQRFVGRGFAKIRDAYLLGELYKEAKDEAIHEAFERGAIIARQLKRVDIDLSFVPVLDINYDRNPIIDSRCFAQDPKAVCDLAFAFCQGLANQGFASVAKHFPGHGWAKGDSHHLSPEDSRNLDTMMESDILPYQRLIDSGVINSVMISHVRYPKFSPKPATFAPEIITDLLKGKLGFKGPVMTDDLVMAGANIGMDMIERSVVAQNAGCDLLLWLGGEPVLLDSQLERVAVNDDAIETSPWASLLAK